MPIRFRCVYCNQLLGISRRKAGTVVRCTNCGGQIIVPEAEADAAIVGAASANERNVTRKEALPAQSNLLEHGDFEALLKPLAGEHPNLAHPATPTSASSAEAFAIPEKAPSASPPQKTPSSIPMGVLIGIAVVLLLSGLIVGYFVGRGLSG